MACKNPIRARLIQEFGPDAKYFTNSWGSSFNDAILVIETSIEPIEGFGKYWSDSRGVQFYVTNRWHHPTIAPLNIDVAVEYYNRNANLWLARRISECK